MGILLMVCVIFGISILIFFSSYLGLPWWYMNGELNILYEKINIFLFYPDSYRDHNNGEWYSLNKNISIFLLHLDASWKDKWWVIYFKWEGKYSFLYIYVRLGDT